MRKHDAFWKAATAAFTTLALCAGGCGSLLPEQTDNNTVKFTSYEQVEAAYNVVTPGRSDIAHLRAVGFDPNASSVDVLSFLGVIERFMPRESIKFSDLDPAVRQCVNARTKCVGYVFHPKFVEDKRVGNAALDLLAFKRTTVTTGWEAEVIVLMTNNIVIYKVISGKPSLDKTVVKKQPLGPFQDIAGGAANSAVGQIRY